MSDERKTVEQKNVYTVKLAKPVKTDQHLHGFSGKESMWLYVVATSFSGAHDAVLKKYPEAEIRGVDLMIDELQSDVDDVGLDPTTTYTVEVA